MRQEKHGAVVRMLRFIYCLEDIKAWKPCQEHTDLFSLAERYRMPLLKETAKSKLVEAIRRFYLDPDVLFDMIEIAYRNLPAPTPELRRMMVDLYLLLLPHTQDARASLARLMVKVPVFGLDLASRFIFYGTRLDAEVCTCEHRETASMRPPDVLYHECDKCGAQVTSGLHTGETRLKFEVGVRPFWQ